MSEQGTEVIAAIDVGTNSFHMVVASVTTRGALQIHSRMKETVRLGSSAGDMKQLSNEAMKRGIKALKHFKIEAKQHGAQIRAVATSAVREAANREEFVDRVADETGINLEVVSGLEEGRLIYIGAMHSLPIIGKRSFVIDIGGGSTESVVGFNGETQFLHSAKLGHLRISKRFFPMGKSTKASLQECRESIRGDWSPVFLDLLAHGFEVAVGCSGTIAALATMTLSRTRQKMPESLNGLRIARGDLLETINIIAEANTTEKREALPGLDAKRGDVILGGALILEQAIIGLNIQHLTLSSYALREGIVFDTAQKKRDISEYHHLSHLRYQSVNHLCDLYQVRRAHAEHVKTLSLTLFDELKVLHGLGDTEREILEAAALLHDVGYHISADQHHKHSEYLIRNSVMPGFTNDETELIAAVARYHRKSHPKKKHPDYAILHKHEKSSVQVLSSILRIAEGLDRRQQHVVENVHVELSENRIDIYLTAPSNVPDIELWGAERRKGLLAETFDREVRLMSHAT